MHNILTLLTPSAALPGLLSQAYKAEKQLERYEKLREKPGALTATDSALSAAEAHFRSQVDRTLALLDNMELCDTPPQIPTFKASLGQLGIELSQTGQSEFWRVVESAARSGSPSGGGTPAFRLKRLRLPFGNGSWCSTRSLTTPPGMAMR